MAEYDLAAEQGIIEAAMRDPSQIPAMLEKGVKPLSFGVVPFRMTWEAMVRLSLSDRPVDQLRLMSELGALWTRIGPLWQTATSKKDLPLWQDFLPTLHAYQMNRGAEQAITKYQEWWRKSPKDVSQYLPMLIHMLSGVGQEAQSLDPRPGVIYSESSLDAEGVPTGIKSLDRMLIGGWRPTELIMWTAPTKHGKTSMASTLAANQVAMGNNVIVFSLEMGAFYFVCRVLCTYANLEWKDVVQKKVPQHREQDWREARAAVNKHLRVYPPQIHTPEEIGERVKWHQTEFDRISLVIVDHMGLVHRKGRRDPRENIAFYVEQQAYGLKGVAAQQGVALCVFAQMSRQQEQEVAKTGDVQVFGARGSAGVAHACDFGFLLYRKGTNTGVIRKKLDRLTGQTDKAEIEHDPRYYWFRDEPD